MKLLIFTGMTIGGYVGWDLCERCGLMIAFLASSAGSAAGVVAGWWLARRLFD